MASGLKVIVGCISLGLPAASYYGLRLERDEILKAQDVEQRVHPQGPRRSIPTHLYRFVLISQLSLALVILLLVFKDLNHLENTTPADMRSVLVLVAIEIVTSFVVLLIANAVVAYQYSKNLKLLLNHQLEQMDAVARGTNALVPVVSNHEIAQIGDRTNSMIESLKADRMRSLFSKLVSPQVAQKLLGNHDADAVESGGCGCFIYDLRDFTALSESCSPRSRLYSERVFHNAGGRRSSRGRRFG